MDGVKGGDGIGVIKREVGEVDSLEKWKTDWEEDGDGIGIWISWETVGR